MTKEYLIKPAKSSRTPNNSEPSTTSNLAKTTSNTELTQAARQMIPSNTLQMIGLRTTTIQNGKEEWSGGFTNLRSYLRSTRKILTNFRKAEIKRKCGMGLRLLSVTRRTTRYISRESWKISEGAERNAGSSKCSFKQTYW